MTTPGRQPRSRPEDYRVGARVRARRIELGLTLHQVAGLADELTTQQLQKYEKGINRISAGRLVDIALALGVEPGFFFTDGETAMPERPRQTLEIVKVWGRLTPHHQAALMKMARALAEEIPAVRSSA